MYKPSRINISVKPSQGFSHRANLPRKSFASNQHQLCSASYRLNPTRTFAIVRSKETNPETVKPAEKDVVDKSSHTKVAQVVDPSTVKMPAPELFTTGHESNLDKDVATTPDGTTYEIVGSIGDDLPYFLRIKKKGQKTIEVRIDRDLVPSVIKRTPYL